MITLRDYQIEALDAVEAAANEGKRRTIVALPTGAGKTIVFAHLLQRRGGRGLVLAHRDELIEQAVDKIGIVWPEAVVGVVKAERNELLANTVVASVQTAWRPKRLEQLQGFDTVIVDETHHAAASTYKAVLEGVGAFDDDGPLTVGFTATPERGDGQALGEIFDGGVVYQRTILEMIGAGYLCDIRARRVQLDVDFRQARKSRGDFVDSDIERLLDDADAPRHAADAYLETAAGRKAILFTPTIRAAHEMEAEFRGRGIAAEAVSGETPIDERRAILRRFSSGETMVVANCFDAETELLTRRGWIGPGEISSDDVTAAVDPSTGDLRWEPVLDIIHRPRAIGERMVEVTNQTLNMRVTEGHRMLWRTRGVDSWRITEAQELPYRRSAYQLRVAAHGAYQGVDLTDAQLEFLGLFATDGSMNRERASIEITQATASPVCAEIERVLTECGFDWKVSHGVATTPAGNPSPFNRYRVPKGNIGGTLARSGWVALEPWLDKSLSPALADMTAEQFRYLLHGLWLGDGLKSNRQKRPSDGTAICGADRVLLDRVQEWAVTRGMACSQSWLVNDAGGRYPGSMLGYVRVRDRDIVTTNNRSIPTSGGNPARFITSETSEDVWCVTNQTGTVIARRQGRVVVAGQCSVLTEGFDEPSVDAIIMARPTLSRPLYIQMLGRGLRPYPGKSDCLLLDLVGNVERHDMVSVADIFDASQEALDQGATVTEAVEAAQAAMDMPTRDGAIVVEDVDVWHRRASMPSDRGFGWVTGDGSEFYLPAGDSTIAVVRDTEGRWMVLDLARERADRIVGGLDFGYAQGYAEDEVRRRGAWALASTKASWRERPASTKQIDLLERMKVRAPTEALTAGMASDLITIEIAKSRIRRMRR